MKTKTKKRLIKMLSSLMIIFSLLNLIGIILGVGSKVYADFPVETLAADGILAGLTLMLGGLPLIMLNIIKLVIIAVAAILQVIISGAYSSLEGNLEWTGLGSIIFAGQKDASQFLDVNFFDLTVGAGTTLLAFRTAVAKWYYVLRLISAAILLVILIYVGIKMAISTIASEQAKYKQMLVDWVTSLALLFLLHYIIMFIITVNSSLVGALAGVTDCTESMMGTLIASMFHPGILGLFAAVIYAIFVGQIFSFFVLYMKRMITVGFLIMISPLITITYAIDKMGDGKAQALNAWLKELAYNILIQPFHCVIFLSFFDAIAKIIDENAFSIGAYIFAIVIMQFMKKAEDILRKIFHFEASSMSSLSESGQSIANATGKFTQMGMKAGSAFASFKAAGGVRGIKQNMQEFRENRAAKKLVKETYKRTNGGSLAGFKEEKKTERYQRNLEAAKKTNAAKMAKEAADRRDKKIEKNRAKYDKKHGTGAYDRMIDKRVDAAQREYDKKNGAGAYDEMIDKRAEEAYNKEKGDDKAYERMKNMASKVDKHGRPTKAARMAQAKIHTERMKARMEAKEEERNKEHNKVIEEGGVGARRNIKNAWKNTGGRAFNNMRKFADSDYGKLVGAAAKDSIKLGAGTAVGAFILGATSQLNDAISGAQTGYGFAKGVLNNSTKTVVKDSAEKVEQLAALQGVDLSDTEGLQKILAGVKMEKNAGALDTKSISNQLEKLEKQITSLFSDRGKGNLESSLFVNAIQSAAVKGELNPTEIERLINSQFSDADADEKSNIKIEARKYAEIVLKAGVASNETTLESSGVDVDEHDAKVVRRVTKTNTNTVNFS